MSTTIEQVHEVDQHFLLGRARACVLLFIISDVLSVFAILAAGGYLSALNVLNQFKQPGDHPPALVPGLIVALLLVLSGLAYYWWARSFRQEGRTGQRVVFVLSWVGMIVALVVQVWLSLRLGYAAPLHAYDSLMTLITWYSAAHLLLASIIGLLLFGRIMRDRMAGRGYIVEATGYWWYYTVIATLLLWVFSLVIA